MPVSTFRYSPSFVETYQNDQDFLSARERAGGFLYAHAMRVAGIILAVIGGCGGAREEASLKSVVAEADQAAVKFYQIRFDGTSDPLQLACEGPDNLALSTGNQPWLRTLFTELLTEIRYWSQSLSVQWAEDQKRLGMPAAKIELTFERWAHTVFYISSKNEGLGLDVAAEVVLDADGRMELTPGKPVTMCFWLPLTLPETF